MTLDKAKVESAVQVVQRWIVMRLRHRRFFSVREANEAIRELLIHLNQRPFRKRRDECRASLFEKIDRPALKPLPAERYDLSLWAQARVNIDYHVAYDGNWYSVPYTLTGEQVDVRSTPTTVEIFHSGKRVLRICAAMNGTGPSARTSIAPKAIRRIWNGRHRAS